MTDPLIPGERDLPGGRHAQRRAHLMAELTRQSRDEAGTAPPPPAPSRRPRFAGRLAAGAVAAAAVTVAAVAGNAVLGKDASTAQAAVVCAKDRDHVIARIMDPLADRRRLGEDFRACGFDIDLRLVPASPSVVGTIVMMEGDRRIHTIDDPSCRTAGGGACPIGLRIEAGFTGRATVVLGRAARPGEPYDSTNSSTAKGEALEGVPVEGRTVAAVEALVAREHLTIARYNVQWSLPGGQGYGDLTTRSKVDPKWRVMSVDPYADGQVVLMIRPAGPVPPDIMKKLQDAGPPPAAEPGPPS
ncbi:hypothetical protein Sru01_56690 [Sphaerisporangium rufum]|uniref:Uncharacterized protein n=1 Tax=Sphaerisporangium rufum TaxID=1381558 RepID=A0A919R6P5_9ACTN|nr:hypothetical protein [Sphaerisporangium rufum]GII80687.1 hypothetical protein Sru01_56690 [Sphaerisporangium rufum]